MYELLDETIVTFAHLQCSSKVGLDTDAIITAKVFELYNLNPLEKYIINYEIDLVEADKDLYFVYFAREKMISQHLELGANRYVDVALFYPQIFAYLFANKSISELFLVASNIDTRIFVSIFRASQLIYTKQLGQNEPLDSLINYISKQKINDIFVYSDRDSGFFGRVIADIAGEKQISTIEKIDWSLAKKYARNFSTKQKPIPIFKRKSGIVLLCMVFFILTSGIYEVINFQYQKYKVSQDVAISKTEQPKLVNLRNVLEQKNKECAKLSTKVQNQKNELISLQNTVDSLQELRMQPSVVDDIVKIANGAKSLELRFENLCIVSGEINIKLLSQNPTTISTFSSILTSNSFEIFQFDIRKTESGYKGQISGTR